MLKTLPTILLTLALLAACGGDDSDSSAAPSSSAGTAAPVTVGDTTERANGLDDPEFVDLLAWCLGWHEGASIDLGGEETAEASALDALFGETDAVVPPEISDAWRAYTSSAGPEDPDYRLAYREIDQFWVDNCADHVTIGTKITQP
jgi:hypothetical protein